MIYLLFTARKNIGSKVIRLATWSKWSHVALLCSDGSVIESVGKYGVRRVKFSEAVKGAFRYSIVQFKDIDERELIKVLETQLEKGYDYPGAIGIGLHGNWQKDNRWVCSELLAWGFQEINKPLFRKEEIRKVSPQHLWQLNPDGKTSIISIPYKYMVE